ncbi:YfcC family protein [Alkalicoccobacillus murimartini]|uniref:Ion transporter superfamily protein YfcC n=1 Tax=Alkalicoccobacillus murimartini TaxID=171685 RepID=A0ABT9YKJ0_9BACI|nr:TRAP transporter large permease subunit [Alkalicoccobacillus murimartini]MDQ0208382.1 putative ion transporter superfamily protein YfcC [Alkalicoccobacillus murimartini]
MKKPFQVPHIYVILVSILVIAFATTFVVPSGSFEREELESGANILMPGTFSYEDKTYLSIFDLMFAIPSGLIEAGEIIFGILMIGGMFAVLESSGLVGLGIGRLSSTFKRTPILVIPALMIPLALLTTFTSAIELSLVFAPVVIPLMLRLGYDRMTALAVVLVSTVAGFTSAITGPATVGVAHDVTGIPLYEGVGYRSIIFVFVLITGVLFVCLYARKVKKDPSKSLLHNDQMDAYFLEEKESEMKASKRQLLAAAVVFAGVLLMIYGLIEWGWYFKELGGLYATIGILVGVITKIRANDLAEAFNKGFQSILLGALVVGIARSISVILEEGEILDTVIQGTSQVVSSMPEPVTAVFMMFVQGAFNFLVPSGSGQAMITMPIMGGLADIVGITRQTAVLAFQFGDGFANIFYPTSGYFMATLAISRIPWDKWVKFIWPLLAVWYVMSIVFLIIAQLTNWGAGL